MKNSGQISFDLMFAVLIALVTIQAFLPLVEGIAGMQNEAGIRAQEKAVARDLARVVKTAQETGVSVNYKIPEIYAAGLRTGIGCDITVDSVTNTIKVTVGNAHYPELSAAIIEVVPASGIASIGPFNCGQQATFS